MAYRIVKIGQEILGIVILPFAYGAATRVPFVFAGTHVLSALNGGLPLVSFALGAYQLSRVAGNSLPLLLGPRAALAAGAAFGVAGYAALGALPAAAGSSSAAAAVARFAGALALVGLSEQITSLQHLCRSRYANDHATSRARLQQLYACNVCGTSAAFLASGVAYARGGLAAAARVGLFFESVLLLGSLLMPWLERQSGSGGKQQQQQKQQQWPQQRWQPAVAVVGNGAAAGPRPCSDAGSDDSDGGSGKARLLALTRSKADEPSWISYVLAFTFCLQALLIGSVLSVAPLIITQKLGLGPLHIGLAFGAGEAAGSAALLAAASPGGRARLRRALPTPFGLLAVLVTLGAAAVLLAATPAPLASLLLVFALMALNDIGTSLSGECLGNVVPARSYLGVNALANMLRRGGNTFTCVLGPLLYAAAPWLPFAAFGALTVVWAGALALLFAQRARELSAHERLAAAAALGVSCKEGAQAPPPYAVDDTSGIDANNEGGAAARLMRRLGARRSAPRHLFTFRDVSFVTRERAEQARLLAAEVEALGAAAAVAVEADAAAETTHAKAA